MPSSNKELADYLKRVCLTGRSVAKAFLEVDRADFVLASLAASAYVDTALPIAGGASISQPQVVAVMLEALDLREGQKVLEVGAGSGYNAALLAHIVGGKGLVVSVDRSQELLVYAKENLEKYAELRKRIELACCDGSAGYSRLAPYDRIIVTAACPNVPQPLLDQLRDGGKMVLPVGLRGGSQDLVLVEKKDGKTEKSVFGFRVVFVPLVGEYGFR